MCPIVSAFGRQFKSQARWGSGNPHYPEKFDEDAYNELIDDILGVLTVYGYVEPRRWMTDVLVTRSIALFSNGCCQGILRWEWKHNQRFL